MKNEGTFQQNNTEKIIFVLLLLIFATEMYRMGVVDGVCLGFLDDEVVGWA